MGAVCCGQKGPSIQPVRTKIETPNTNTNQNDPNRRKTNIPNMKNFTGLRKITNIHDHYILDQESLGEGSFGKVYLAKNKSFETRVALKVIKKEKL